MSFVEWVQVITQIVTAATAVIMAVLAYRTYLVTPDQEPESEKASTEEVVDDQLKALLIFSTSKQKTWLRVTDQGLECHLEDNRPGKGGHQWTLSKHEIKGILEHREYSVNPGMKARVGYLNIGPRRGWLYSKSLYPAPDYLEGEVKQLLQSAGS